MKMFRKYYIRAALLMLLLAMVRTALAQGSFNPTPPSEPGQLAVVKLKANPAEAARVSGGGSYTVGSSNCRPSATSTHAQWKFVNWTNDASGTIVSTASSFYLKVPSGITNLTANFEKVDTFKVVLLAEPAEAASSLSGGGTYEYTATASRSVSCSNKASFTFRYWTRKDGTVVSNERYFTYRPSTYGMMNDCDTLTAHFDFTPGTPAEPDAEQARQQHTLYVTATPDVGGYVAIDGITSKTSKQVYDGDKVTLTAYNRANYRFISWVQDGIMVSTDKTYIVRMGKHDINMVATFEYSPDTPAEPEAAVIDNYTLTAGNTDIYIGQTAYLPVSLENSQDVDNVRFTLTVPKPFSINKEGSLLTARVTDGTMTITATEKSDSTAYLVTIKNGDGNFLYKSGVLVNLLVECDDIVESKEYDVRMTSPFIEINSETVKNILVHDGKLNAIPPLPTGKKGDVNNDGKINERDLLLLSAIIVRFPLHIAGYYFNLDNADMNNDRRLNITDWMLLLKYINKNK